MLDTDANQTHQEFRRTLVRRLQGILGRKDLAEDFVQEAYVRCLSKYGHNRGSCLLPLVWTAAMRRTLDWLRLQKKRHESSDGLETHPASGASDPSTVVMLADCRRIMVRAAASLPGRYREPFEMRYFREMSLQEIADDLRITRNALEQRLTRAMSLFRQHPLIRALAANAPE